MHNWFSHNAVLDTIRNLTGVTSDLFKERLNIWLFAIPDKLPIPGYSSSTGNSLITWRVDSKDEQPGHSGSSHQLRP
ncbi:hypothetical protein E2C01_005970 [Portunus trituberculatus]|uniref:Uncharacterized protein n=1 Tax=Portunus trituberculatus TaxID=210409 RepID=A0A5B7CVU7_PORTR|nr:hypothetical protein [Portunus trituberculatus]